MCGGDLPGNHDFVIAVQASHSVTLSERGIVKSVLDEVIDGAVEGHRGLSDVDKLRSSLPNRVNTKNLTRILMEEQFQHAHFIP